MKHTGIAAFLKHHYRHFNAASLIDAADGYVAQLNGGGRMMITLAGAMSTAELGLSLAEMIRRDKVHAITCTGANLEEDIFNLVAHDHYIRVPNWRNLSPEEEKELERNGLVIRTDFNANPPHVEYRLSPLGRSLSDALLPLDQWVNANSVALEDVRKIFDETRAGR